MKITKIRLKQIIKEELDKINEMMVDPGENQAMLAFAINGIASMRERDVEEVEDQIRDLEFRLRSARDKDAGFTQEELDKVKSAFDKKKEELAKDDLNEMEGEMKSRRSVKNDVHNMLKDKGAIEDGKLKVSRMEAFDMAKKEHPELDFGVFKRMLGHIMRNDAS